MCRGAFLTLIHRFDRGNTNREQATEVPRTFRPKDFVAGALQNTKVKLTWDEDDEERVKTTRHRFTKEDLKKMDFKAYLASSDEGDSDDEQDEAEAEKEDPEEIRRKYRALLDQPDSDDSDQDDHDDHDDSKNGSTRRSNKKGSADVEGDLEITFAPGLSEVATQLLEKKQAKNVSRPKCPF